MDKSEVFQVQEADLQNKSKPKRKRQLEVESKPNAKRQKESVQALDLRSKQQLPRDPRQVRAGKTLPSVAYYAKRQKESVKVRSKQQLPRDPRQVRAGKTLPSVGNGQLGTIHSSEAEVSDAVTSRKALGELQPIVVPDGVLGKVPQHPPVCNLNTLKVDTLGEDMECPFKEDTIPHLLPPNPSNFSVPLEEIGSRFVGGLKVDSVFRCSSYLADTRAKLRKVFERSGKSRGHSYKEMLQYFSSSGPATMPSPFIAQLQQDQHTMVPPGAKAASGPVSLESHRPNPTPNQPHLPSTSEWTLQGKCVSDRVTGNLEVETSVNDSSCHTPMPRDLLYIMGGTSPYWNSSQSWNSSPCTTLKTHPNPTLNQPHLPSTSEWALQGKGVSDRVVGNLEVETSALNHNGSSCHTPMPRDVLNIIDSMTGTSPYWNSSQSWNSSPSRPCTTLEIRPNSALNQPHLPTSTSMQGNRVSDTVALNLDVDLTPMPMDYFDIMDIIVDNSCQSRTIHPCSPINYT